MAPAAATAAGENAAADGSADAGQPTLLASGADRSAHPAMASANTGRRHVARGPCGIPVCGWCTTPPPLLVYGALFLVQMMFGAGVVIGKFGLHTLNPVVFALCREGCAGPILCIMAAVVERARPRREDLWRFFFTGLFIYGNQCMFMLGLSLASSTQAAIWQPSQLLFTLVIARILGRESLTPLRVLGVVCAIGGAIFMVAFDGIDGGRDSLLGSLCFFGNCMSTSAYHIATKPLFKRYGPLSVAAWSYITAAVLMAITALIVVRDAEKWTVPVRLLWVVAYWVLFSSVAAYAIMTWANKHTASSVVSAYTTVRVLVAALLSWTVMHESPAVGDLGAIGVIGGMALVLFEQSRIDRAAAKTLAISRAAHVALPGDDSAAATAADAGGSGAVRVAVSSPRGAGGIVKARAPRPRSGRKKYAALEDDGDHDHDADLEGVPPQSEAAAGAGAAATRPAGAVELVAISMRDSPPAGR